MTGLILIIFAVLTVLLFVIALIDKYGGDEWASASGVCLLITLIFLLTIPISRIDSKRNAEYMKVLQETISSNRANGQDFSVLERTAIIDVINKSNSTIVTWKTKGHKWYNNKWYYHPSVHDAQYLK